MSKIKSYVIDFSNVKQWHDIPDIISTALDFPKWYGYSLDILDEVLTNMMLSEESCIEIRGLEKLKKYDGYDKKIRNLLLSAKHSYGVEDAKNLQIKIIHEDGTIETLADELEVHKFVLDFSGAQTRAEVINEFARSFDFEVEDSDDFSRVWHFLQLNLTMRISILEIRGIESLKAIDDTYGEVLEILSGIKESWNGEYSDRFFVNIL